MKYFIILACFITSSVTLSNMLLNNDNRDFRNITFQQFSSSLSEMKCKIGPLPVCASRCVWLDESVFFYARRYFGGFFLLGQRRPPPFGLSLSVLNKCHILKMTYSGLHYIFMLFSCNNVVMTIYKQTTAGLQFVYKFVKVYQCLCSPIYPFTCFGQDHR